LCYTKAKDVSQEAAEYLNVLRQVFNKAIDSAERSAADKEAVKFAKDTISHIFAE